MDSLVMFALDWFLLVAIGGISVAAFGVVAKMMSPAH